jgi:ATP synthase F1 epsilon subunit
MSFKIEIVSPEKIFVSKENVKEVVLPAYEGEMGILKDHISIISFLKPGIIKVYNSDNKADNFYIEDGIIEFNDNCLTVLTSKISDIKNLEKLEINKMIRDSEKELNNENIEDGTRYLINQKLDTLRSLSLN